MGLPLGMGPALWVITGITGVQEKAGNGDACTHTHGLSLPY